MGPSNLQVFFLVIPINFFLYTCNHLQMNGLLSSRESTSTSQNHANVKEEFVLKKTHSYRICDRLLRNSNLRDNATWKIKQIYDWSTHRNLMFARQLNPKLISKKIIMLVMYFESSPNNW